MKNQRKQAFQETTHTNATVNSARKTGITDEEFAREDRMAGDSVDEHKQLEEANQELAKKEISQTFHNS
ncbi:hypothetical protein SAMN05192534_11513 [Alteribacillus persepolensis]|uniref:YfhD-like protein n=1 Tax=Alteribacillus persepolensis TaxID=568899 RepID=A0A1G8GBJ3_9BACI|nr:hypothetical protein [Alteribacillus persepolensis]SDH91782.1 hypothetical protein SAMN05192534_11513 [Alteribacillus persepolensis]